MTAEKQAVIDRSGNRERYLRGEVTFTQSKKTLRESAVRLGVVKPLRPRPPRISDAQKFYDDAIIDHLIDEGLDETERWDEQNTRKRLAKTLRVDKRIILSSDRSIIRREARRPDSDFDYDFNPWWYH
jgi:hypothetical protein